MFNEFVYVEKDISNHPNTLSILNKINAKEVVYIKHYKDVFNQSGSDWRRQKATQKLILAQRTEQYYYTGSDVTPDFGFRHFYYNTLALNCLYDCDYCYLQGLFNSAHMVLFVNNETFIDETEKLISKLDGPVYFALSYDTDLLAIDQWYSYITPWINFVAKQNKLTIEIRTKSVNIKPLKSLIPNNQTILAWTLSPQKIISIHEPKTPSEKARISAIKEALRLGWRVRICIDPILHVPDFKEAYTSMIKRLAEEIDLNKVDSISLGVFRMNHLFLKRMQQHQSDSGLLFYPYQKNGDTLTYSNSIKDELIKHVIGCLKQQHPQLQIVTQ
ncbi:MAG: DNA photolyase [Bacteroidia bacterium]|jgi:spore photoproduct lyase|nr:DNA photolyase [Bacteroidia bacterium]